MYYTMKYYSALKKNELLIYAIMDKLQKHYAKWNQSDTRDYILDDSIYMKCPKKEDLWSQKLN